MRINFFNFFTEVDVEVIGSHNTLPGNGKTKIKWELAIKQDASGIKEFSISVPDQVAETVLDVYDEFSDEEFTRNNPIFLKDVEVEDSSSTIDFSSLKIEPVLLQIYNNKATVFYD